MAEIIIMPKLGFNMNEGKLVKWYKKEGERVQKGENLFSVETDKTNMDIEATDDGVVRKLLIEEGDQIPVTLPIAIVGDASENIDGLVAEAYGKLGKAAPQGSAAAACQESAPQSGSSAVCGGGTGEKAEVVIQAAPVMAEGTRLKITPRARRVAAEMGISLEGLAISGTGFDGGICEQDILLYASDLPTAEKHGVTPVARNVAAAEAVNLETIIGTGANGKITRKDVEGAMASSAAVGGVSAGCNDTAARTDGKRSADGKEILEEIPYTGVRKIIGQRLSASMVSAPHVYFTQSVNLEKLLSLRKEINGVQDQKISVTDFISRAVVMTLQKYPDLNSSLIGENIVKYKTVNLGVAVAAPGGLIVPAIKNAEKMSVAEISRTGAALIEKARTGKLTPDEYTGGTFTISNLGMFGIENFTAIINPPEVGILAISATKDAAVVIVKEDGTKEIAIKPMMNIQISVDHRVIDGLLAAQFVGEVKRLLEAPVSLLV